MKAFKTSASDDTLLDPTASFWRGVELQRFDMYPAPLAMVETSSRFLARSTGHGSILRIGAAAAHNGRKLAIWLSWQSQKHDAIKDLDQFVDGVAVMWPLSRRASAFTMGAKGAPVNAWMWRANRVEPFGVFAEGFASVRRQASDEIGDLAVAAQHVDGRWTVVFRRELGGAEGQVKLLPGQSSRIAFAAWDGGNAERSGRKSFSGEFADFELNK